LTLQQVVAGQERFHACRAWPDGLRLLERGARLVRLVVARVELPEDRVDEPLTGVVLRHRLERLDGLREREPLVGARVVHALDEAPLAVGRLLGQLPRLLVLLERVVRVGGEDGEVVLAHREIRVGGHDLLRQLQVLRALLEVLHAELQLLQHRLRLGGRGRPLEALSRRIGLRGRRQHRRHGHGANDTDHSHASRSSSNCLVAPPPASQPQYTPGGHVRPATATVS
jgi:hypothetical protein